MNINKINNTRIKRQLKEFNASPSETQIILNNVFIYNHLIDDILSGKIDDFRTINLIFQMNAQIMKQLEMLSKRQERKVKEQNRHNEVIKKLKIKEAEDEEEDEFIKLIRNINTTKTKQNAKKRNDQEKQL